MDSKTLHITIGQTLDDSLDRAASVMEALEAGESPEQYFGIGFDSITRLNKIFTPKRWELIERLRREGAMTIYALAKLLKRNYKNVRTDVVMLMEWGVIRKNEDKKVFVPWDEIDVRWPILKDVA